MNDRPRPDPAPAPSTGSTFPARGRLWTRLRHGFEWCWRSEAHASRLPRDLFNFAMHVDSRDRFHAKQGRSTARVRLDSSHEPFSVFLKRHATSGWRAAFAALFARHKPATPGPAEWVNLNRAAALGVRVPTPVACGERLRPGTPLQSFLMIEELRGLDELHLVVPRMARSLSPSAFAAWKRAVIAALARSVARLHAERLFHKDLYLCHFFATDDPSTAGVAKLTLIDLHRLAHHRWTTLHWLVKDLGQLLFSTFGVDGITDADRLRFWRLYRRARGWNRRPLLRLAINAKAGLYWRHETRRKQRTS